MLRTAEAALISAIEIYNKPAFAYREETFSILAVNAWELMLKSKLLSLNKNDPRCLYVKLPPTVQNPRRARFKRNRTGNVMTIGVEACMVAIEKAGTPVPAAVKANLEALTEIRDNAVHFINASPLLAKQVLEIGTASLRNFIELGKLWLGLDLSSYSLYLMPIGFLPAASTATGVTISNDEQNVVNYLASLMNKPHDNTAPDYHVSLDVNISFKRTSTAAAAAVIVTNDPNAMPVTISEEDIRRQYPWDYATLNQKMQNRYIDFKENAKYHALRKQLALNPQYMRTRYLDPGNPRSSRKDFYNPNIMREFDKTYTLKK
jgi:Protein of unknown function (DUF3644)